ncbi:MAG: hypothetical protein RL557_898 [archaeon]|jgi:16S rRNA (cytosine1407-C5)-methyltransferase
MQKYPPKEKFVERMKLLLRDEEDVKNFFRVAETVARKSIRVNTLKISVDEMKKILEKKGWNIRQPFVAHPEIMIVQSELKPGELGKTIEHLLGYYYIQEITSMMPILALAPCEDELLLDSCASPGSKTTQAASLMHNKGTIIANDISIGRIAILVANLERCGVANTIVTRHAGNELAEKLAKLRFAFDKILVDAPCSGEGNIRCSPRTYLEWSEGLLKMLSRKQKKIVSSVIPLLKQDGLLIYSTCTHAPEENEEIIQFLLDTFDVEVVDVRDKLPVELAVRPGITEWKKKTFHPSMKKAVRIYHHDNDMEGFFVCGLRKKK